MKSLLKINVWRPLPAELSALALVLVCAVRGHAAPPVEPLPPPFYSFDLQSPTVLEGIVGAADVLAVGASFPEIVIPGAQLGLTSPYDNLDSLSSSHAGFSPGQPFVILFSVDRASVGAAPPDPVLIGLEVPYNVQDQAFRGQAAGDQYASAMTFVLAGGPARGARGGTQNNTLARNNFDEGGVDFVAVPYSSASETPGPVPQDDVDAAAYLSTAARGEIVNVYFSASRESPSLQFLPSHGMPSGAHLYFNPHPQSGGVSELFAPFFALGLQPMDDIDAAIIFDFDSDGLYGGNDVVLFSLSPSSPSLLMIPGASPEGAAADIFIARPGLPTQALVNAVELGLGSPTDNIDALEIFPCADAISCAALHGIRALRGDLNCDDLVNAFDIDPFVLALTDPAGYYWAYPECDIMRADVNQDGAINAFDIDPFVRLLTGGLD